MEETLSLVTVLEGETMVDVSVLADQQGLDLVDVTITASTMDEAEIILLHEVPGALPLEGLRGRGLDDDTPLDLAGWYQLQKEL